MLHKWFLSNFKALFRSLYYRRKLNLTKLLQRSWYLAQKIMRLKRIQAMYSKGTLKGLFYKYITSLKVSLIYNIRPIPNVCLGPIVIRPKVIFLHNSSIPTTGPKHYTCLNTGIDIAHIVGPRFMIIGGKVADAFISVEGLISYYLKSKGFNFYIIPVIIKTSMLYHIGHLPYFKEEMYELTGTGKTLIPTSEVCFANFFQHKKFIPTLPYMLFTFSECFRKESDKAGQNVRGILRNHQFRKGELFAFTTSEEWRKTFIRFKAIIKTTLRYLGFTFRIIQLPSWDIANQSAMTYDFEVWMPRSERWLEVSSLSICTDYQTARFNQHMKNVYTINGTCLPLGRIISALIEYNKISL